MVGAHLLYRLTNQNEKVRATKRAGSDVLSVKKIFSYYTDPDQAERLYSSIEWVEADILDIPALSKAFDGIDKVYHCAALISFDPSDEKKLRKINIEGTANVVNLCISKKIRKLCYTSSVAALGSSLKDKRVDEMTKWNPEEDHNYYAISKYGAEIEVWRASQEGLETIIVNPGIILGPGYWNDGSGKIFSKIAKGLKYHFPKVSGFVGVRDVVDAMTTLMDSHIQNEKFILVAENLSFEKVLKWTAVHMNKPKPHKQLKKWMIAIAWISQKIGSWLGMKQRITRDNINGLFESAFYDNSKIKESIDFKFTPVDQVLKESAAIYIEEHRTE